MKFMFVLGGVVSGCGKGIATASLALLLKSRGHNVSIMKSDPYLNTSASTLSPGQHGECYVTDDALETDLDLGHYERLGTVNVGRENIFTSGQIYQELMEEQANGQYLGQTIQLMPHVTNKIIKRWTDLAEKNDITLIEIGGTIGDSESFGFLEAIRQLKLKHEDVLTIVVAPILWFKTIQEFKTKPLQNAVKELQRYGINPDVLLCRVNKPIPNEILDKVSNLTGVPREAVFDAPDVSTIYQVPIEFYNRHIDDLIADRFRLKRSGCRIYKYRELVDKYNQDLPTLNIGVFGKYNNCCEAYASIKEALIHAGLDNDVKVNPVWVNVEELEKTRKIKPFFDDLQGIIVPGGFDTRGIKGKIKAIKYARENNIPFLGICLGLQCAVIEFAINVCGIKDANSMEFDKNTPEPVIHYLEGQQDIEKKCGTLRLGAYDCVLEKDSLVSSLYGRKKISERHRHRLEVNPEYLEKYKEKGLVVSGTNPETGLVEVMELNNHPYFLATQAHPEFKSRWGKSAPMFKGLIAAASSYKP